MQNNFKFFRVLAALAFAVSTASGAPVSFEKAQNTAQKYLDNKRGGKIKPSAKKQRGIERYFVFDKENGGFIIIAADDVAVPILGETDKGTFNLDSIPPALVWMLSIYDEQIASAVNNGAVQDEETKRRWAQTPPQASAGLRSVDYPAQILTTKWGQGEPFNLQTPTDAGVRSLTGCVATAMAQIMKRWDWPIYGTGSSAAYNTASKNISVTSVSFNVPYDWKNMIDDYPYANSGTTAQRNAVAQIMYHAGISVKMDYTKDASGAYDKDAAAAFKNNFGYDNCLRYVYSPNSKSILASDWKELVMGQIENSSPVFYGGQDVNKQGGHAFVIDGYDASKDLFHLNWGWYGIADGYFALTALNPTANGKNFSFINNVGMVINIMPNQKGNAPSQLKLTAFNISTNKDTVKASITAKMNYGADFSGKIGFAFISGDSIVKVLDSANYSIANTSGSNNDFGVYTVNRSTAILKRQLGVDIPAGDIPLQVVTKRGTGAWTPVGEISTISSTIDLGNETPLSVGIGWTYANNVYTVKDGADVIVKGVSTNQRRIEVESDAHAKITMQETNISSLNSYQSPISLNFNSQLTLTLTGVGKLAGGSGAPGIKVVYGAALIINGNWDLNVSGGANAAGIGGAVGSKGGDIIVEGGIVNAQGGTGAAGISGIFTLDGNCVVYTNSIDAEGNDLSLKRGILFIQKTGTAYGTIVFDEGFTVDETYTLSVPAGATIKSINECVLVNFGTLKINGGTVLGRELHAITNNGTLNLTDGAVFAFGTGVSDVINGSYGATTGDCAIIAWNDAVKTMTYNVLSNTDIFAFPSSVSALWNGKGGIAYEKEYNKGFIAIDEVSTVKLPGGFGTPVVSATYSPMLKLDDVFLPDGYTWKNPLTAISSAGSGQNFAAEFSEPSGNYETVSGNITVNVLKAAGAAVLPPSLDNKTYNSVTIKKVIALSLQNVEYGITAQSVPESWQDSLTFENLIAGTDYKIFARAIENSNYKQGVISAPLAVKTNNPPYAINKIQKSGGKSGILLKESVVSDSVEFTTVLNSDKAIEVKVVIYDNTGNVVFKANGKNTDTFVWDLTNGAGRKAASGTYLIVAEAKSVKGTYTYSAKVGVKR